MAGLKGLFQTNGFYDQKFSKSPLPKCTFKPKPTFQRVRSDGLGTDVCLCIISQYADAEGFVSNESYGMEGSKDYPGHCSVG